MGSKFSLGKNWNSGFTGFISSFCCCGDGWGGGVCLKGSDVSVRRCTFRWSRLWKELTEFWEFWWTGWSREACCTVSTWSSCRITVSSLPHTHNSQKYKLKKKKHDFFFFFLFIQKRIGSYYCCVSQVWRRLRVKGLYLCQITWTVQTNSASSRARLLASDPAACLTISSPVSPAVRSAALLSVCVICDPRPLFFSSVNYEGLVKDLSVCQPSQMGI